MAKDDNINQSGFKLINIRFETDKIKEKGSLHGKSGATLCAIWRENQ